MHLREEEGGAIETMPAKKTHLIVGLGNPGPAYAKTRHNIGFMLADRLIEHFRLSDHRNRLNAEIACGEIGANTVWVVKPMSYMNRSGDPVDNIIRTLSLHREDMVVIHDDIDLAYERLKIKEKGGDGGHNGVRSLIDALGTDEFLRVRLGVGRPEADIGVVDYVLGEFDTDQYLALERFLSKALEAVEVIFCQGAKNAMNRFNRKNKI